jgi:hypothetical protein
MVLSEIASTAGRVGLRLEQHIADGNLAACHYLGVDAHVDVAEGAPEGGDDVEVAFFAVTGLT